MPLAGVEQHSSSLLILLTVKDSKANAFEQQYHPFNASDNVLEIQTPDDSCRLSTKYIFAHLM